MLISLENEQRKSTARVDDKKLKLKTFVKCAINNILNHHSFFPINVSQLQNITTSLSMTIVDEIEELVIPATLRT